ncbi:MAG TPA: hypothetical protein VHB18_16845 [Mycobacteriales bacterium]|jgi:hypothetical protein|nr:hypothetical protein [Mycobacteriales bacterium]
MHVSKRSAALAAAAAGAVVAVTALPALGTAQAKAAHLSTPHLTVTADKSGTFDLKGPRHFSAGRVDLTLHAKKGEQEIAIMRLHSGYTLDNLKSDFGTFGQSQDAPSPDGIAALNNIVKHTTFYGGLDSGAGHTTVNGSVVLPKAGTYYLLNDENGPGADQAIKLHVSPRAGSRTAPSVDAKVTATNAKRFGGAVNLPAKGTIEFTNKATNSPHFLFLMHVKKGTTRKVMVKALQSPPGQPGGPNIFRDGSVGTDVLFMGHSQTLTYDLPAGTYAEVCFFPDLKTGMPHALMGMVRMVHLK